MADTKARENLVKLEDPRVKLMADYDPTIACVNGHQIKGVTEEHLFAGERMASVICLNPGYCYPCAWPCKNCLGATQDDCLTCIGDHVFRERFGDTRRRGNCERPEPLKPPVIIWSNVKYRVQLRFEKPIELNPDFMKLVKITLVGGAMARRRLRVLAPREYKKTRMLR